MMAGCDACAVKIRGQALFIIHGIEREKREEGSESSALTGASKKSASGAAGAFDLHKALRRWMRVLLEIKFKAAKRWQERAFHLFEFVARAALNLQWK